MVKIPNEHTVDDDTRTIPAGGTHVASIGPHQDLTYPTESLGLSAKTIEELVSGKHPFVEKMKAGGPLHFRPSFLE